MTSLFLQAHESGRLDDGIRIVEAASQLRATFADDAAPGHVPSLIRLSPGEVPPTLFAFTPIVATAGPHDYARFAGSLDPAREIVAVPAPGFHPDELLPASVEAGAVAQAEAVARHATGEKVVLVGYSTGGLLAYAAACQCVQLGLNPFVVMIDTYTVETAPVLLHAVCSRMASSENAPVTLTDTRLTAMGAYLRMLRDWKPFDADLPTLFVQASDQVPGLPANGDWQAQWRFGHSVVPVPGDHFTIMQDHAGVTVQALERWLERCGLTNSRAELR